jgi:hypothetical protein
MYLFFVRQFNDIDHITPIVWKMNCDGYPVGVFCLNPAYNLQSDYRLSFLRNSGVKVSYVYDEMLHMLGIRHRALRFLSKFCYAASTKFNSYSPGIFSPLRYTAHRRAYKLGKKLFNHTKSAFYNYPWALALLERNSAQALCFDHVNPGRHVVGVLLDAAKTLSVPALALPHGVYIYTNKHVRTGSTQESRFDKFNRFDCVVTQNDLRKEVLARAGVKREKLHVLGSARYADEWMTQNKSILPRENNPNLADSTGLKIVFMTTRFSYKIDVDRMLKTFDLLARLDNLHVVVKPHTRSGSEAKVYDNLSVSNVSNLSSVELCEWADVVLVIGSSILIEPLKLNKPVLYLKYLHDNTTQYEEMGACWTIHDEQELMGALKSLIKDPQKVPYTKESIDAFLSEIVYGGGGKKDVLKVYEQFIVNHSMA